MISTDNKYLFFAFLIMPGLYLSCSSQKVIEQKETLKELASFQFEVAEVEIVDEILISLIDDMLTDVSNCSFYEESKSGHPIYFDVYETRINQKDRLSISARNWYSITFNVDDKMNSIVSLDFNPIKMAYYKGYYINFIPDHNEKTKVDFLSNKIRSTNRKLSYTAIHPKDENGDLILFDSKRLRRIYEIVSSFKLKLMHKLPCDKN